MNIRIWLAKKCLHAWILGPAIKLFWFTLVTPKSINNEFNQSGGSLIHFFYYERSWTDSREPRHKTQREKACDLLLSMRHVVAKIIRKHTCGLDESKDSYLRSITHIHTHIPMYVRKDKIFILLTWANLTHLFDRLY